jgi:hypothetical protein
MTRFLTIYKERRGSSRRLGARYDWVENDNAESKPGVGFGRKDERIIQPTTLRLFFEAVAREHSRAAHSFLTLSRSQYFLA